jgi:signal transduction histidine kinase/PAS domain-containing protein
MKPTIDQLNDNQEFKYGLTLFGIFFILLIVFVVAILRLYVFRPSSDMEELSKVDSLIQAGTKLSFADKSKASDFAAQALISSIELDYPKGQADSYRLNSIIAFLDRDYLTSLEYLELAALVYDQMDDSSGLADADITYGHIYRDLNQFDKSKAHYQRAYEFYLHSGKPDRLRVSGYNYANLLFEQGDSETALQVIEPIFGADSVPNDRGIYALYLNLKARIGIRKGDWSGAVDFLQESLRISTELGESRNKTAYLEALFYLGRVYRLLGDTDLSRQYIVRAQSDPYLFRVEYLADSIFNEGIKIYEDEPNKIKEEFDKYFSLKNEDYLKYLINKNELKFKFLSNQELVKANVDLKKESEFNFLLACIAIAFCFSLLVFLVVINSLRKRKEKLTKDLKIQTKRYLSLFENSPLPIVMVDTEGEMILCNSKFYCFEDKFGSDITGSIIRLVLAKCQGNKDSNFHYLEFERGYFHFKIYWIISSKNKNRELTITIEDYSELKESLLQCNNLNELLNQSYDVGNIGSFSFRIDQNDHVEFEKISNNTVSLLSLSNLNRYVFNLKELFDQEGYDLFKEQLSLFATREEYFDCIVRLNPVISQNKWIRIIGKVTGMDQNFVFVSGILQDVSAEKKLVYTLQENLIKEKELNLVKSKFMSMTSHEFRTPISVALSSLDMIDLYTREVEEMEFQDKLSPHLKKIYDQLNKILNLMDDILILERTSLVDKELKLNTVFVDEFVERIALDLGVVFGNRVPDFKVQGEVFDLVTDAVLFEYLISNLISNAFKYSMGKPNPEIEIDFSSKKVIKIVDFGIGIPQEDLPFIFNSFFRASNSKSVRGTGLGLAIVNEICKRMNFNIKIDSELHRGTSILLELVDVQKKEQDQ